MKYEVMFTISGTEADMIDDFILNGGLSEDDTIVHTAVFVNGFEADIKCCGAGNDPAWTEGVLFDTKGRQVCYTEPAEEYLGEWYFESDGDEYIVIVGKEIL